MATVTSGRAKGRIDSPMIDSPMIVSTYDRAACVLIASLILVGTTTVFLFIIWLTSILDFSTRMKPVRMIEYPGRGDHAAGFARDMEPPGVEELEEVLEEPQLEAALEAMTDVASTVAAARDALQTDSALSSAGDGQGDSRPPGPLGEGENVVPPWERWQIKFESTNLNVYAQQLDQEKIELAAIGGAPMVDYASELSKGVKTRKGSSKEERRVYMTWKDGKLLAFDKQLLARGNIKTDNRILMQFIPDELNKKLHQLEFNYTDREPEEWYRTVFGLKRGGKGWEFYVISMMFRPAPPK
jgi:hypothetical protein